MVSGFQDVGNGRHRPSGPELRDGSLAGQLGDLARTLQQDEDTGTVLVSIVHAALELVPHAVAGSFSVVRAGRTESFAASGELPRLVDALQNETGQGPCLDAAYEEQIVRVPDVGREKRWPDFARRAWQAGARSMLSFQLLVRDDNLGALNLYGDRPGVFDSECEQIGRLVAAHAAVAFAGRQEVNQLNEALATRDLVGQAKGILMERFRIDDQQAFMILVRSSSVNNIKLRDVAEHLTRSGEILIPDRNL